MEAVICNFRRAKHQQTMRHLIIQVKGVNDRKKAETMLGKKVVWTSSAGKKLHGEIKAPHGNKGALRAIFEHGVPGQALGGRLAIEGK